MRATRSSLLLMIAVGTLLASGCQRALTYFPSRGNEEQLVPAAARVGLQPWQNDQGQRIGWKREGSGDAVRPAFVVFHGNAGQAVDRDYFVRGIQEATLPQPWDVFILEYPGYGSRVGTPSERAVTDAAADALSLLFRERTRAIYLVGESLGSGVASQVAARYPHAIRGVWLVTPFTRLAYVAETHYPRWLVSLILSERYDNSTALRSYAGPLAILIAGADEVTPPGLGQQLYEQYAGPKRLWAQPGRTHNTLSYAPSDPYWREAIRFLQQEDNNAQAPRRAGSLP